MRQLFEICAFHSRRDHFNLGYSCFLYFYYYISFFAAVQKHNSLKPIIPTRYHKRQVLIIHRVLNFAM